MHETEKKTSRQIYMTVVSYVSVSHVCQVTFLTHGNHACSACHWRQTYVSRKFFSSIAHRPAKLNKTLWNNICKMWTANICIEGNGVKHSPTHTHTGYKASPTTTLPREVSHLHALSVWPDIHVEKQCMEKLPSCRFRECQLYAENYDDLRQGIHHARDRWLAGRCLRAMEGGREGGRARERGRTITMDQTEHDVFYSVKQFIATHSQRRSKFGASL